MSERPTLQGETLYSLRELVEFIPRSTRTGRKRHRSVLWRWASRGLKAGDGETRVFLEVVKAGGSLATSKEAIHRFFEELTRLSSLPNGASMSPANDQPCTGSPIHISNVRDQLDSEGF